MKICDSSFEILDFPENAVEQIARAARVCYQSEPKTDETSFVKRLIETGHHTPLEMASATVRIVCDRGVSHELVRHRLASFNQESTRYCSYKGGIKVIRPSFWRTESKRYLNWKIAIENAEKSYMRLLELGASPQEARSVLPNSLATNIIMSANFREFRHVFNLRCSPKSHPQIIEIAMTMLAEFHCRCPVVFEDVYKKYFFKTI